MHPGNRIPLIPRQTGKAYASWEATKKLVFDLDEVTVSSSYPAATRTMPTRPMAFTILAPASRQATRSPTFWHIMIH